MSAPPQGLVAPEVFPMRFRPWLAGALLALLLAPLLPAGGDPAVTSLTPNRSLAVWDLTSSLDYNASSEIAIAGGNATLGTAAGSFLQDQGGDFTPNGSLDAALEIAGGAGPLAGGPSE